MAIASGLLPQIKCNQTLNQTVYSRLQKQAFSSCCHYQTEVSQKWFKFMQRHCWNNVSYSALVKSVESLWITRKSVLLNWNSSTIIIRENKAWKYLKRSHILLPHYIGNLLLVSLLGKIFGIIYAAQDPEVQTLRFWWFMACYWRFILPTRLLEFTIAHVEGDACLSRATAQCECSCLHLYLISFEILYSVC